MTNDWLSTVAPYPPPRPLAPDYHRHAPADDDLLAVLDRIGAERDWGRLGWGELVDDLLALGRADVPLSRLAEGHVDALRILAQAGRVPVSGARYGVWASRSQRTGVQGRLEGPGLILDGTIRFASGAGILERALVPVWTAADEHLLVDLAVDRLPVDRDQWSTEAMAVTRSHTVAVDGVAVPRDAVVGPTNFYLDRPAFFPGGVGVAACWAGGAARIADLLRKRQAGPSPAAAAREGRIRVQLTVAGSTLRTAARRLDDEFGRADADLSELRLLSTETRAAVAGAVHTILDEAHRLAGPAGLAFDEDLTRTVHDLRLYVLQQNADADEAYLGGRAG